MRALLQLDISSNDLGQLTDDQGRVFKFSTGQWWCSGNYPEGHNKGNPCKTRPSNVKPRGIITLANAIPGMGALSSLNLASNEILSKESGRALADVLKTNSVLTELDLSDNQDKYSDGSITGSLDGAGFAKELAVGISDNGALLVLSLKANGLGTKKAGEVLGEMLKGNSMLQATSLIQSAQRSSVLPSATTRR
jgi:Ran GTPase-activating protein (RanGAP) involved in mRNA processing and transport